VTCAGFAYRQEHVYARSIVGLRPRGADGREMSRPPSKGGDARSRLNRQLNRQRQVMMTDYRVYSLTPKGMAEDARDITCETDKAAIRKARAWARRRVFEIWQSTRRVYPAPDGSIPSLGRR
jgi:hypothetical protein